MFRHWFLDHPNFIGETYGEYQRALAYSASLFMASVACFIHALVPCFSSAPQLASRVAVEAANFGLVGSR
jgi:hypothetical protein